MSGYRKLSEFVPHNSNTICDLTGFKCKTNEVRRQWDGAYVRHDAWSARNPQDFAPTIYPTKVYKNTRFQLEIDPIARLFYATALNSGGSGYLVSSRALSSTGESFDVSAQVENAAGATFTVFALKAADYGLI